MIMLAAMGWPEAICYAAGAICGAAGIIVLLDPVNMTDRRTLYVVCCRDGSPHRQSDSDVVVHSAADRAAGRIVWMDGGDLSRPYPPFTCGPHSFKAFVEASGD